MNDWPPPKAEDEGNDDLKPTPEEGGDSSFERSENGTEKKKTLIEKMDTATEKAERALRRLKALIWISKKKFKEHIEGDDLFRTMEIKNNVVHHISKKIKKVVTKIKGEDERYHGESSHNDAIEPASKAEVEKTRYDSYMHRFNEYSTRGEAIPENFVIKMKEDILKKFEGKEDECSDSLEMLGQALRASQVKIAFDDGETMTVEELEKQAELQENETEEGEINTPPESTLDEEKLDQETERQEQIKKVKESLFGKAKRVAGSIKTAWQERNNETSPDTGPDMDGGPIPEDYRESFEESQLKANGYKIEQAVEKGLPIPEEDIEDFFASISKEKDDVLETDQMKVVAYCNLIIAMLKDKDTQIEMIGGELISYQEFKDLKEMQSDKEEFQKLKKEIDSYIDTGIPVPKELRVRFSELIEKARQNEDIENLVALEMGEELMRNRIEDIDEAKKKFEKDHSEHKTDHHKHEVHLDHDHHGHEDHHEEHGHHYEHELAELKEKLQKQLLLLTSFLSGLDKEDRKKLRDFLTKSAPHGEELSPAELVVFLDGLSNEITRPGGLELEEEDKEKMKNIIWDMRQLANHLVQENLSQEAMFENDPENMVKITEIERKRKEAREKTKLNLNKLREQLNDPSIPDKEVFSNAVHKEMYTHMLKNAVQNEESLKLEVEEYKRIVEEKKQKLIEEAEKLQEAKLAAEEALAAKNSPTEMIEASRKYQNARKKFERSTLILGATEMKLKDKEGALENVEGLVKEIKSKEKAINDSEVLEDTEKIMKEVTEASDKIENALRPVNKHKEHGHGHKEAKWKGYALAGGSFLIGLLNIFASNLYDSLRDKKAGGGGGGHKKSGGGGHH
ncbi:MAG: hypothetical protein V4509_03945 [Patescibacteria group bacterium]